MTRIMFVCHGNICRSPLAEFVTKDLVRKNGLSDEFLIASAATSGEETGNPVYEPVKQLMRRHSIPFEKRAAVKLRPDDYEKYDLFLVMDENNLRNIRRIFPHDPQGKIRKLLSFGGEGEDIADPWYYGNFETVYQQIVSGCQALLRSDLVSG